MSDRTFRLILDGKKGRLVKGSSPSSAAKKACKKLSAETGKTSFKFEWILNLLQVKNYLLLKVKPIHFFNRIY